MERDVIIIGGGPAGMTTALTAKSVYPEKSVCLVKEVGDGIIPCAIPYMIYTMSDPDQNKTGDTPIENAGVEIIVGKAVAIDTEESSVSLESGQVIFYERLVLATGNKPALPPIPGIEKGGVFSIEKSLSAMSVLRNEARKAKHVVILGGGFIGAEFADELARGSDAEIHIVEKLPKVMEAAFDDEFCDQVTSELFKSGAIIHTDERASSIDGGIRAESVALKDGKRIPADMVLIGIGGKPNTTLAERAGLRITDGGSIWVDSYMRTSVSNVFAVGDCALKRDFFTRHEVPIWLASTATAEARIAGTNIYGIRVLRKIQGTIAAFSTRIGNVSFASAGFTSRIADDEKFRWVSATAMAPDRHPGTLPGAFEVKVKLVVAERSGIILGCQMSGGISVGELINIVALAIQKEVTVSELDMMQIATHPLLTSAPTVYPLINAAQQALAKLRAGAK